MSHHPIEKAKVYLNDLDEEMVITAYIGFTRKYHSLSPETCQFLSRNFKNAQAIVSRDGSIKTLSVNELKPGDRLCRIFDFPKKLHPLTTVNNRLIRALRSHGMLRFEVEKPATLSLESKRDLLKMIEIVKTQTRRLK